MTSNLLEKVKQLTPSDRVQRVRAMNNGATVSSNGKITKWQALYYLGIKERFRNAVLIDWQLFIAGIFFFAILFLIGFGSVWFLFKP